MVSFMDYFKTNNAKHWIKYADEISENNKYFAKFMFYWLAFNSLYSEKNNKERKQIANFIDKYLKDYLEKFPNKFNELEKENSFKYLKSENIKDLKKSKNPPSPGYDDNDSNIETHGSVNSNNNVYRMKGYLNILYTIRCNLFHGDKTPIEIRDEKVVKNAYFVLKKILDIILN